MFRMRRTATVNLYPLFSETRRLELQTGEGKVRGEKQIQICFESDWTECAL